jgi:DNA-binding transcriptional LysR family regulator
VRVYLTVAFNAQPLSRWGRMFHLLRRQHPDADLVWQALEYPVAGRPALEGADVGLLVEPQTGPDLDTLTLWSEELLVAVALDHPLAARGKLSVSEVLDQPFLGSSTLDPGWQAFWTLDRERGGPPKWSDERVENQAQAIDAVASGRAIAIVTAGVSNCLTHPGIATIPLIDARPAAVKLVWRAGDENPLVAGLVEIAREMAWREGSHIHVEEGYVGCPRCGLVIERGKADGNGSPLCPDCRRLHGEQVIMNTSIPRRPEPGWSPPA